MAALSESLWNSNVLKIRGYCAVSVVTVFWSSCM